jgi:hypothetical protein
MQRKVLIRKKDTFQKRVDDLKKHFTDRLWSGLGRTNTTLLAWITALFLIFISSLVPLGTKLSDLNKLSKSKEKAVKQLGKIQEESSLEIGKVTSNKEFADELQMKIEGKSTKIEQLKKEISALSTPFGTLSVPVHYTPLIWISLFAGLLCFFLYRRSTLFFTLAKLIDLNITDSQKKIDDIKGLATGTPFWLAPLPYSIKKIDGNIISKEDLKTFMGWETGEQRKAILTISIIALGFLISFWVLLLAFDVGRIIYGSDRYYKLTIPIAVAFVVIVSVISCIYFLRPQIDLKEFSSNVKGDANGRRHFLKTAGAAAIIGLTYTFFPVRAFAKRIKRYKSKKKMAQIPEQFRNQFCVNKKAEKFSSEKSLIIHYIGAQGFPDGKINLNPRNLAVKTKEEIVTLRTTKSQSTTNKTKSKEPHLNPNQFSPIIECLVLEKLNLNQVDAALDILWNGIVNDTKIKKQNRKKPSYRLYDLLVGLAFKYSRKNYQDKLAKLIESEWTEDAELIKRNEKWSKPNERWLSKWNPQQPLNWKHSFNNWKTATKNEASIYSGYFG